MLVCVLKALHYLNVQGLVHRDIKPANVMRLGNIWKLGDFGMVKELKAFDKKLDTFCGTPFALIH